MNIRKQKGFCRSRTEKRLFGVCSGIAYYVGVDPAVIRLIAVLMTVCTAGALLLGYVIMALIIPEEQF